jgi:hypothetical protein
VAVKKPTAAQIRAARELLAFLYNNRTAKSETLKTYFGDWLMVLQWVTGAQGGQYFEAAVLELAAILDGQGVRIVDSKGREIDLARAMSGAYTEKEYLKNE